MLETPIKKTRRTAEQLAALERARVALCAKLSDLVKAHWSDMNESCPNDKGFRVVEITLGLPESPEGKAFVGVEYQPPRISVSDTFVFDDGQNDLPGT
jgi:hypothetical protein